MAENSGIAWTDNTFNPWIGCTKVSEGCRFCYAENLAERKGLAKWGPAGTRVKTAPKNWGSPLRWDKAAAKSGKRTRVFCASLADVFEDRPEVAGWRKELWGLVEETPNLDWQFLTKRPENIMSMIPGAWLVDFPSNVWVGCTVESGKVRDARLSALSLVPATVRFISAEPLVGPLELGEWSFALDWVIVGGESGPGARPMDPEWARSLRDECASAGIAFFFKQVGSAGKANPYDKGGKVLDGNEYCEMPEAITA